MKNGKTMIIKSATLEIVCGITSKIPETALLEFAFAGKSNVGKSTLINGLMNRKSLARTSGTPGKTQTINYYNINNQLYFVDLPGYGYTKANIETKAKWGRMVDNYLTRSLKLKAVFLLLDIRHNPSENDKLMYDWITQSNHPPIIIATKADKLKRSQLPKHLSLIRTALELPPAVPIIPYSAPTKQGRDEIYKVLSSFALENGSE